MSYYVDQNGNAKKVLSVALVKEVEVDYYVGCATLETSKQDSFVVPQSIQVGATYFPILDGTKTSLVELGGNSVNFNQLLQASNFRTITYNGLTIRPLANGKGLHIEGTAESGGNTWVINLGSSYTNHLNHKCLLKSSNTTNARIRINDLQANTISTLTAQYAVLDMVSGRTYNEDIELQFFDLTLMGLDDITSVEEFEALFPSDYYEYNEGEIKSTILSSVKAYSPQNALLGTINLPNAPITLNGLNDIHDLLTFEEQENGTYNAILTRKIGVVDLGNLNWRNNNVENGRWLAPYSTNQEIIGSMKALSSLSEIYNALCGKYNIVAWNVITSSNKVMAVYGGSNGGIYIADNTYNSGVVEDFKTAMSGVNLYYELATPTTETIATGLTFDQVSTLFEKGGTIVVENSNTDYIKTNLTMAFAVRRFRTTEE